MEKMILLKYLNIWMDTDNFVERSK